MNWKDDILLLKKSPFKNILFLCVANSARSQMAEGIARSLAPKSITISSAGSVPTKVNPLAIQALLEIGIDITSQYSKDIDSIKAQAIDIVITLCSDEVCPIFNEEKKIRDFHWPLSDPQNNIESFRMVRDELTLRLTALFKT